MPQAEREREVVRFSSFTVPEETMKEWLPRLSQIVLVELVAAVLALDQLLPEDNGKSTVLFVDSEPAESAVIKGNSTRSDICDLAAYFLGRRCCFQGLLSLCEQGSFRWKRS